jgi:hypothetical protein
MREQVKKWWVNMDLVRVGYFLGMVVTCCAIVFAATIYWGMGQIEDNIAYMALYYDDMAVEMTDNPEVAFWASSQAWRWCEFYTVERRTVAWERYIPLCDDIQERHKNIAMTAIGLGGFSVDKIQTPLRKEWEINPPYSAYVFREEYKPVVCMMGADAVPCPWE